MKYIMSLDGGGTKLLCLIADENGKLCSESKGGPVNTVFHPKEEVQQHLRSAVSEAVEQAGIDRRQIAKVYCIMPADPRITYPAIREALYDDVPIEGVSEFAASLYGAIQQVYGGLSLGGTGSFAQAQTKTTFQSVGGWGAIFGDEGSGYDVGRKALIACSHMNDKIGPETAIHDELLKQSGCKNMREYSDFVYGMPTGKQRSYIASVCRIVAVCAAADDAVALDLLKDAGMQHARQMIGVLQKCGESVFPGFPVSVAGGVWKAHPIVYRTYKAEVEGKHPNVQVLPPLFEPVAGGILLGLRELGYPVTERIDELKRNFAGYLFPSEQFA